MSDRKPEVRSPGRFDRKKLDGRDDPAGDVDVPIYSVDGLVRRAEALQRTPAARRARGEVSAG